MQKYSINIIYAKNMKCPPKKNVLKLILTLFLAIDVIQMYHTVQLYGVLNFKN